MSSLMRTDNGWARLVQAGRMAFSKRRSATIARAAEGMWNHRPMRPCTRPGMTKIEQHGQLRKLTRALVSGTSGGTDRHFGKMTLSVHTETRWLLAGHIDLARSELTGDWSTQSLAREGSSRPRNNGMAPNCSQREGGADRLAKAEGTAYTRAICTAHRLLADQRNCSDSVTATARNCGRRYERLAVGSRQQSRVEQQAEPRASTRRGAQ